MGMRLNDSHGVDFQLQVFSSLDFRPRRWVVTGPREVAGLVPGVVRSRVFDVETSGMVLSIYVKNSAGRQNLKKASSLYFDRAKAYTISLLEWFFGDHEAAVGSTESK